MLKKLKIVGVAFLFAIMFAVTASADTVDIQDYGVSVNIPSGYTALTRTNIRKNEEIVGGFYVDDQETRMSAKSLKRYMEENNIYILAINNETSSQFKLSIAQTDFSKGIKNLTELDAAEKAQMTDALFEGKKCTEKKINGTVYFTVNDENSYTYVTVMNKSLIMMTYYGTEPQSAELIASRISYKGERTFSLTGGAAVLQIIIAAAVTLAAIAAIILISASLINDYRNRDENDDEDEIKIKRRKR